jgi:tRNA threonylcarbamoyladenosine biosynthesis protein TsaB
MRILGIETAGAACSIALTQGAQIISERHEVVGRGHAERLMPWIADLPGGGRADQIIVGCGPGSFTGVRIGIAAARALAFGWEIPAYGVSSLSLIAAEYDQYCEVDHFTVAVHGEIFVQNFERYPLSASGIISSLSPLKAIQIAHEIVIGSGAKQLMALRNNIKTIDIFAHAASLRWLTQDFVTMVPCPLYIRDVDAKPMQ